MSGYTHRDFRTEATALRDGLRTVLGPALEHRHAGLVQVGAGKTQLANSDSAITAVYELATRGDRILAEHDARLTLVSEAQALAGGVPEVAADKNYNQD